MKSVYKFLSVIIIFTTCFGVAHSFAGIEDNFQNLFQNASPRAKRIFPDDRVIHCWRDIWFLKNLWKIRIHTRRQSLGNKKKEKQEETETAT